MFHAGVCHFTVTCLFSHKRRVTLVHDLHERAGLCLLWRGAGGPQNTHAHLQLDECGSRTQQRFDEVTWNWINLQPVNASLCSFPTDSRSLNVSPDLHTPETHLCVSFSVSLYESPSTPHNKHMLLNGSLCVLVCVLLSWLLLDLSCWLNSRTKDLKRLSEKQEHENKHDKGLKHVPLPVPLTTSALIVKGQKDVQFHSVSALLKIVLTSYLFTEVLVYCFLTLIHRLIKADPEWQTVRQTDLDSVSSSIRWLIFLKSLINLHVFISCCSSLCLLPSLLPSLLLSGYSRPSACRL